MGLGPTKEETSIAKNFIGKVPELKILDGDIYGARVVFDTVKSREKPIRQRIPIKRENGAYNG